MRFAIIQKNKTLQPILAAGFFVFLSINDI